MFCNSKHYKRLVPLLAAPAALLLSQGQAKAVLNVNIFDDGPNLMVTVNGSISGSPGISKGLGLCGPNGFLSGQFYSSIPSLLCTGNTSTSAVYPISGPAGYGGSGFLSVATSVVGFGFMLIPSSFLPSLSFYSSTYQLDDSYVLGTPYFSSATFNGRSLASEGFTATGLVGTWTIDGTSESINVCIGSGPCASNSSTSVPGPLPLLGAAAAFGWSRRLRKRIATPLITPPQA
jgi:MYXO-CTERM domain-containing protein